MVTKELLVRLYQEERLTDSQISRRLGLHHQSVYRLRKRMGIKAIRRADRNVVCPTDKQREVLTGCLLGDGSISAKEKAYGTGRNRCESVFECKHGQVQHAYLLWKYSLFGDWCRQKPDLLKTGQLRMRTFASSFFSSLREEWYIDGVKGVPVSARSSLSSLALAVWYMDDGHLSDRGQCRFCTCSFSDDDCIRLSSWLEEDLGIMTNFRTYQGYNYLYVPAASQPRFFSLIKPHILPMFDYKVNHGKLSEG